LGEAEEIVGEHSSADEQLEPLSAFSQTTLHAASPEQDRDAALDAGAEALAFFESGTFLDRFALGGFLAAPLGDGDELDTCLLAGGEADGAVKAAVGAEPLGGLTKGLLMALECGFDVVLVGRVSIQHAVLSDEAASAFGQKHLVAKLDGLLSLAPFDQVSVAFKDGVNLLITGDLLCFEHPAAGLINDAVAQLAVVLDLFAERLNG
jgi:hypothetical protein